MTVLAVFRSRAQTMDFASRMQRRGAAVQIVNTPKGAGVGCSLSAAFDEGYLGQARLTIEYGNYSSFSGFLRRNRYDGNRYDRYGGGYFEKV
jgi:hypothetical protein